MREQENGKEALSYKLRARKQQECFEQGAAGQERESYKRVLNFGQENSDEL